MVTDGVGGMDAVATDELESVVVLEVDGGAVGEVVGLFVTGFGGGGRIGVSVGVGGFHRLRSFCK